MTHPAARAASGVIHRLNQFSNFLQGATLFSLVVRFIGENESKMDWFKARDAHFGRKLCVPRGLRIDSARDNTSHCLAAGRQAVISLSRAGWIVARPDRRSSNCGRRARSPGARIDSHRARHYVARPEIIPVSFASLAPGRSHVRRSNQPATLPPAAAPVPFPSDVDLVPAISLIAERANLSPEERSSDPLRKGDESACRARAGRTAPDLGVRLQSDSGISPDCVRTAKLYSVMMRRTITVQLRSASAWECDHPGCAVRHFTELWSLRSFLKRPACLCRARRCYHAASLQCDGWLPSSPPFASSQTRINPCPGDAASPRSGWRRLPSGSRRLG